MNKQEHLLPTVKIVTDDLGNLRPKALSYVLESSTKYENYSKPSQQINQKANVNIVTVFKDYNKFLNLEIPDSPFVKKSTDHMTILDVSEDLFDRKDWGPLISLLCVSVDFVICSNSLLQERIYEYTGRLASIVANPYIIEVTPPRLEDFEDKGSLLWFGSVKDIFSIRPFTKTLPGLDIASDALLSHTDKFKLFRSERDKTKILDKYSFVFLPKTFNEDGELRRLEKVKEALYRGKAVFAPDLEIDFDNLAINADVNSIEEFSPSELVELVKQSQQKLVELEGKEAVIAQLERAIEQAKTDDFFAQLLENQDFVFKGN